jgi:hypothetical protein
MSTPDRSCSLTRETYVRIGCCRCITLTLRGGMFEGGMPSVAADQIANAFNNASRASV